MRLKRETYLEQIRPYYDSDIIKVITGVRRSGKSILLDTIKDELSDRGIAGDHIIYLNLETSVYKGYKQDKIEMRGDRAEMSDFPLYLNMVAGGLDRRDQTIGGFSFVVKIYALPVVEIIGQFLYLLGRYGFDAQIGYCF